jgi:hypothetical protein
VFIESEERRQQVYELRLEAVLAELALLKAQCGCDYSLTLVSPARQLEVLTSGDRTAFAKESLLLLNWKLAGTAGSVPYLVPARWRSSPRVSGCNVDMGGLVCCCSMVPRFGLLLFVRSCGCAGNALLVHCESLRLQSAHNFLLDPQTPPVHPPGPAARSHGQRAGLQGGSLQALR